MTSADINDYALMPLKMVVAALADFDCGREDIDDFFHNKALAYEKVAAFICFFLRRNKKKNTATFTTGMASRP